MVGAGDQVVRLVQKVFSRRGAQKNFVVEKIKVKLVGASLD